MQAKDALNINPLLTERTRLAILSALAAEGAPIDFKTLVETLSLTGGNLSVHADKLDKAGLIVIKKKFEGKTPLTTYACTAKGRQELVRYLEQVEKLLKLAAKGAK